MSKVILENYSKKINKKEVLKNINYTFDSGKIYGLFGRNGSGKTMLLRAIAGLIYPTSGVVKIDGKILHKDMSFPPKLGIIIENTHLLPQYDSFTNLKILSKINNIATDDDIKQSIKQVGLDPDSRLKVKKFSLGMKQRLSIAQAIFEKPDLLLLDEPTNAIDEKGVEEIRTLLLNQKKLGATIIIASHNKEDLSVLADITLKMDEGKLFYEQA
ncbi:MAG TPA: multidrug ABC transporter ATP-binding protein [Eubacteriaceae bacterium]|jgi:ABC-2 type transport system ATP-binding protein|nr:multidrug ABC transporter ATP-binding protein [Eubacteriaceae bacterium]